MNKEESMKSEPAVEVDQDEVMKISEQNCAYPSRRFDASRMIGIIRRKALIKELAAAYHMECLACCQELVELQKNTQEPVFDFRTPAINARKDRPKPPKRSKKNR